MMNGKRSRLAITLTLAVLTACGGGDQPQADGSGTTTGSATGAAPSGTDPTSASAGDSGETGEATAPERSLTEVLTELGEAIARGDVDRVASMTGGSEAARLASARTMVHSLRGMHLAGRLAATYGDDAKALTDELRRFLETSLNLTGKAALDPRRLATAGERVEQEPWGPTKYRVQHSDGAAGARVTISWGMPSLPVLQTLSYAFGAAAKGYPLSAAMYEKPSSQARAAKLVPGLEALDAIARALDQKQDLEALEATLAGLPTE